MIFDKTSDYVPGSNNDNPVGYIALTPVDDADEKSNYFSALKFAIDSEQICNIAITGPFGSGKSSIIKTFEKNNQYKFLNISLASFKEEAEDEIANNLIERSILQQMLYGTDASKLPYSRFKRIAVPNKPLIKSTLFVFWAMAIGYIYLNRVEFLSLNIFNNLNIIKALIISYVLVFLISVILNIYKSFFGIPFKKLSLKNAEIEAIDTPENSILNRHLDEIIYFFQVVDYNVVVIEDLDRFNSPEIFVKLREINKLINDNRQRGNRIKFLYALKDDMFVHNNRVKFFDFIIPVIPIVNSSNSLEMMRRRLKDDLGTDKITEHFIRDVSLYIDDMRLIHNIFNEFALYKSELHSDSLNTTKLLAMMIYKNVYPDDFEKLHHGKGALYEIGNKRSSLISASKQRLNDEIAILKKNLVASDEEEAKTEIELIKIFIGHIASLAERPINAFIINNNPVPFSQLNNWELFSQLFNETNVIVSHVPHTYNPQNIRLGKSFVQLQSEFSPHETFVQRKEKIENKASAKRLEIKTRIHELEKEKSTISQFPLHKLILKSNLSVEEILASEGISKSQPLTYMIKNGYLDESHYLYTSKFYEGRLTRNDHDFLVTIRDFKKPDPKQPIDTPKEVCLSMRPEDFAHNYILNVALIDYLLTDNDNNRECLRSAIGFISTNFTDAEEFFTAYWDIGRNVAGLVRAIAEMWPGYGAAAVKSSQAPEHLALILQHIDENYLAERMNPGNILTSYLAEQGYLVYASDITPPSNYTILKKLKVKFNSLTSLSGNADLLDFAHRENLYSINSSNIILLLEFCPYGDSSINHDSVTANYSAISSAGSEYLKKYIDVNLSQYINDVFLALPNNVHENAATIRHLLNSDSIDNEQKQQIIFKQELIFESFEGIPTDIWGYVLSNRKINISWINVLTYLNQEECENEIVTELLNQNDIVSCLSKLPIEIDELGDDYSDLLSRFIIGNDQINDAAYISLVECLPYSYPDFPDGISQVKAQCLAKTGTIQLTEESYKFAENDELLLSLLVVSNVNEYLANKPKYPVTDSVREKLLSGGITLKQQLEIAKDVTPSGVRASKQLSRLISTIIKLPEADCNLFDNEVISSAIVNALNVEDSILILMRCKSWDLKMTMDVLEQLPAPFSEIAEFGKRPKLPNTSTNRQFAKHLEAQQFISSATENEEYIRINTFKPSD
ncbi:MAG: hypothetical protein FD174_544 [Geobacteraceae bacterium]|nr:MAG: hypothetical protein FD174_544 [Geobacteraceae bacterium]